jgi:hypothetical protein
MSDTPRTDAYSKSQPTPERWEWIEKCEQLERQLNAANERIKQLEETENRMLNWLTEDCPEAVKKQLSNAWMKSKTKP